MKKYFDPIYVDKISTDDLIEIDEISYVDTRNHQELSQLQFQILRANSIFVTLRNFGYLKIQSELLRNNSNNNFLITQL